MLDSRHLKEACTSGVASDTPSWAICVFWGGKLGHESCPLRNYVGRHEARDEVEF